MRWFALGLTLVWALAYAQLRVKSPAFTYGGWIPRVYTCDGADRSPPLVFSGVPRGTGSLVLLVLDPDAPGGTFYHWAVYDLAPNTTRLPEGVPGRAKLRGFLQGRNDFGRLGYGGPCPPRGHPAHRYFFRLFALVSPQLGLPPGAPARKVARRLSRMAVLAEAEWMGRYRR